MLTLALSLAAVFTGLIAGMLSGAFGVGGSVLTIPALRLAFGYPALVTVGTALASIVPVSAAGAIAHMRNGHADVKTGVAVGAWGVVAAAAGAQASVHAGGTAVIVANSFMILGAAVMVLRGGKGDDSGVPRAPALRRPATVALLGIVTGLFSGFLGLGGGIVLVPLLHRLLGYRVKVAMGTSLVAIAVLAVPGAVAHWVLGNVDPGLALALAIGAVPGAIIGARFTAVAGERTLRTGFACMLAVSAILMGASEAGLV